jgi:hypothetical protein
MNRTEAVRVILKQAPGEPVMSEYSAELAFVHAPEGGR